MTSPEGVRIRRILSSCLVSRLTSLYGLLTGIHSTTPGRDSRMPRSMAPLLPVMPMAVRRDLGMGWAFRPRLSIRLQTSRICSSVACDCMTTSMNGAPAAQRDVRVYGKLAQSRKSCDIELQRQATRKAGAYAKFVGREISSPLGIPKTLPSDH